MRISAKVESFRGDSRFETWAISIAVRVGIGELRRARWKDVSLDQMVEAGRLFPHAGAESGSQDAVELMRIVKDAIETKLTPRQREGIVAELSGAPPEEIAARLGTNRNAFYKLIYDARVRLKSAILDGGWSEDHVRQILNER